MNWHNLCYTHCVKMSLFWKEVLLIILHFLNNSVQLNDNQNLNPYYYQPRYIYCIYRNSIQSHFVYYANQPRQIVYNSTNTISFFEYCINRGYALFLENRTIKKGQLKIDNDRFLINRVEDFIDGNISAFGLDCVHQLVYYHDISYMNIKAVNVTNPTKNATVIPRTRGKVTDIKIDPQEGLIFWSEWDKKNNKPTIMRANQDGTNPRELLKNFTLKQAPILAIDSRNQKLFFIDRTRNILASTDYSGNCKIIYSQQIDYLRFTRSMDILGDRLYWISRKNFYFILTDGDPENKPKRIFHSDHDIDCLTVFDPSKQLIGQNRCFNNDCVGLCLPSGQKYKCVGGSEINKNTSHNTYSDEYLSQDAQTLQNSTLAFNTTYEEKINSNSTVELNTNITTDILSSNDKESSSHNLWSILLYTLIVLAIIPVPIIVIGLYLIRKHEKGVYAQLKTNAN